MAAEGAVGNGTGGCVVRGPRQSSPKGPCARGPSSALVWFGLPAHRTSYGAAVVVRQSASPCLGARGSLVAASGRGGALLRLVGLGWGGLIGMGEWEGLFWLGDAWLAVMLLGRGLGRGGDRCRASRVVEIVRLDTLLGG